MTKPTYVDAIAKKNIREFLFSHYKFNKIIGLAGPDINHYVSWCKSKGFTDIEIWEESPDILMYQMINAQHAVNIKLGNILNAELKNNVLYDLDYCVTIKHMGEHIKKFAKNFIMTFSLRAGIDFTIKKFFSDRRETIIKAIEKLSPIKHTIFITDNGKYIYTPYCDTSAMCCIAKIK